ncbi:hypothetical protein [Fusobacterium polymorphum]|uniref:hypothetical protein n=2 Tax=Fusobacterium nucleatum subsp. polymorphum TaxID=76857 RepID=UPI003009D6FF
MEKKTGTLEKLVIKCVLAGVGFLIYKFGVFMHDNIFRRGYPSLLMIPIILIGVYLMAQPVIFILKPILGILSIFEVTYIDNYLEKKEKREKYENELCRLKQLRETNQISEAEYIYWKNNFESKL